MKKLIFLHLLACSIHAAQIDADLGIGYRSDWIKFQLFVNGEFDAELKFDEFDMMNLEGSFRGLFDYFVLMAEGTYGRFWNGRARSAFAFPFLNAANNEFALDQIQSKTAGFATSASGGGGFPLPLYKQNQTHFFLIPLAGYRYDHLRMKIMNTRPDPILISNPLPTIDLAMHFIDLSRQKYDVTYEGPFVGIDLDFAISKFSVLTGYSYHWVRMKQTGTLDLRALEFQPEGTIIADLSATVFTLLETKKNRGHFAKLKMMYHILENLYFAIQGNYMNYDITTNGAQSANRQITRVSIPFVATFTQLNRDQFFYKWSFFSVMFETGVSF